MHNEDMKADAVVTVRLPGALKQRMDARARTSHRSLSAQVLHDLSHAVDSSPAPRPGRFLGRFEGVSLPTDADLREIRSRLWRRLSTPPRND